MNALKHSDRILSARSGQSVMVCEPTYGVNMDEGGKIDYKPGDRLRVKLTVGDLLWCLDTKARSVTFSRVNMSALEIA